MRSVADSLSRDVQAETSTLSASERVELALRLGDEAIDTFAAANGVSREEARRILRRNNQLGRRRSAVVLEDGE